MKRLFKFLGSYSALAAIYGVLSLIAAALVRSFLPKLQTSVWSLLAVGVLLLLVSLFGAMRKVRTALAGRRSRYGANSLIMVSAFIGIVVLINVIGVVNRRRFDVTAVGQFGLTQQTQRVLKELKQPVKAIGFFPDTAPFQAARSEAEILLEEYRYFTGKINYGFVDPDTKPAIAKQYQLKEYGTIVFKSGDRTRSIHFVDQRVIASPEQYLTAAILEVTGRQQKKVYFLSGHGEPDANDAGNDGYSRARRGLIEELYRIGTLNLTFTPEVPEDCAVLIMAGPKKPLRVAEVRAIKAYLESAGKLLILVDPAPPVQVDQILSDWGVAIGHGKVIDAGAYVSPEKTIPAVPRGRYPPVVITSGLDTTYFPEATSVVLTESMVDVVGEKVSPNRPFAPVTYGSIAILPIAMSSPASWLETDPEEIQFDESLDKKGPLALGRMIMASAPFGKKKPTVSDPDQKLTRLVVIGDSGFASNQHYKNGGNSDLFLNSVNWLAEEEKLISIRPKPFTIRKLVVGQNGIRFIRYSSIILFPLAVLVLGGIVWWRRR